MRPRSGDPPSGAPAWRAGTGRPHVLRFLEGPQPRRFELWRAIRIGVEFVRGFRALHFAGPCVTVFGSARFGVEHPYYTLTREFGASLARTGFIVMTGGGPELMEAANRGAREAGGRSLGCNVELRREQKPNPYLDRWITFHHFFVRKSCWWPDLEDHIGAELEFMSALALKEAWALAEDLSDHAAAFAGQVGASAVCAVYYIRKRRGCWRRGSARRRTGWA